MGPGFSGWNEKSGLKQYMGGGGETGDQTSFQTWIGPQGSFTSSFGFALPALSLLPIFLIKWSVIRIRSYKSSETDTHFHEMVPSFSHFTATIILGMKGGLKGQTKAQRQGDFTRMCSSTHINRERLLLFWVLIPIFRKLIVKSWLNCRELLIAVGDPLFANEGESIAEFQERYIQAVKQLFDRYVGLSPDPNHKLIITWALIWCYGSESFVHTVEGRGLWSPKTKWAKSSYKLEQKITVLCHMPFCTTLWSCRYTKFNRNIFIFTEELCL